MPTICRSNLWMFIFSSSLILATSNVGFQGLSQINNQWINQAVRPVSPRERKRPSPQRGETADK
jgi:hypothetical protein